ncbi:MAG: tetratricopeptide repeat protein [Alphaproteobacteria bacterium]
MRFVLVFVWFALTVGCVSAQSTDTEFSLDFDKDEISLAEVQTKCLSGDAKFCFELGLRHDFGEGLDEDNNKAMLLYAQACDTDFVPACLEIAAKLRLGDETEPDLQQAKDLYSKACDLDDPNGCYFLGGMTMDTDEPDALQAAALFSKACDLELSYACFDAALAKMDETELLANTTTAFAKTIFSLFKKGCELEDGDSCDGLSNAFAVGYGTAMNMDLANKHAASAIELWTIACEQGDDYACDELKE